MKYSLVASLILQSTVVLGDLLPVHFKAPSPAHFHDVVRNDTYDFGEPFVLHSHTVLNFALT